MMYLEQVTMTLEMLVFRQVLAVRKKLFKEINFFLCSRDTA
jgi:hypothetical protein